MKKHDSARGAALGKAVAGVIKPLHDRIAKLEQDVAALKTTTLKAGTTWQPDGAYTPGETATHDGSLWVCTVAHQANGGGFDHKAWLIVKRGRDGKDAR